MVQRLALAAALFPQPRVLLLDEPTEGIDPQGVRWLRELLRGHTAAGGTALVSSHVLDEMSRVVDDIVVIEGGVAVLSGPLDSLCPPNPCIHIRTRSAAALDTALRASGASVSRSGEELRVAGVSATRVGELAAEIGLVLEELATETVSRRDRLLELVTAAIDGAPRWA
jgi:ABC-2 type transport system ATP-binding protein